MLYSEMYENIDQLEVGTRPDQIPFFPYFPVPL